MLYHDSSKHSIAILWFLPTKNSLINAVQRNITLSICMYQENLTKVTPLLGFVPKELNKGVTPSLSFVPEHLLNVVWRNFTLNFSIPFSRKLKTIYMYYMFVVYNDFTLYWDLRFSLGVIQDFSKECYPQLRIHLNEQCSWTLLVYLVLLLTPWLFHRGTFNVVRRNVTRTFKKTENNLSTFCIEVIQVFFGGMLLPELDFILTSAVHGHYILSLY